MKKNKPNLLFRLIKHKIDNEGHFSSICEGKLGSGKSVSMLSFCETIQKALTGKPFDVETQVCFTMIELLDFMNHRPIHPPGTALLIDEIQLSADAQRFMSSEVQKMQKILTTCRFRGYVICTTAPAKSQSAKRIRTSYDAVFETTGRMVRNEYAILHYANLQRNLNLNKTFSKELKGIDNTGRTTYYSELKIMAPSPEVFKAYKAKKKRFTNEMYVSMAQEERIKDEIQTKNKVNINDRVNEVVEHYEDYLKIYKDNKSINLNLVMAKFEIGRINAAKIKAVAEQRLKAKSII